MATKGPADERDGERRTTVHVMGPGIAYVHTRELMQSPKVQRLYRKISKIVQEEKKRRREQESKERQAVIDAAALLLVARRNPGDQKS